MAEAITFIVCAFIIGPAIFILVDEWRELRADRDYYREFYEHMRASEIDASKQRHPAVVVSSMPRLRRIK